MILKCMQLQLEKICSMFKHRFLKPKPNFQIMEAKICPLCGGKISREKIKEFESKFKAQESKIEKQIGKRYKDKIKEEKEKAKELLKQQKEMFEDFKETLKEQQEKERERMEDDFEKLLKEKTKIKNDEIKSMKEKLQELEDEREDIEEKIAEEKDKEISKLKQKHFDEKEKLIEDFQKQIRQIESKTPTELGLDGQAGVIDILNRTFKYDDIKETKRGRRGSDILHRIYYNNEPAGLMVYEVKNVSNWDNKFIKQVKEQKTRHSANYALLVSNVLPSKERIICERDGVLVVHPTKVDIVAQQIRNFLVEIHKAKLSEEEVDEKIKEIQKYLVSPDYKNALVELIRSIKVWHDLRYTEKCTHERHWAEEEKLNNLIQEKTAKIHAKIASIIETRLQKITVAPKKKKKRARQY